MSLGSDSSAMTGRRLALVDTGPAGERLCTPDGERRGAGDRLRGADRSRRLERAERAPSPSEGTVLPRDAASGLRRPILSQWCIAASVASCAACNTPPASAYVKRVRQMCVKRVRQTHISNAYVKRARQTCTSNVHVKRVLQMCTSNT